MFSEREGIGIFVVAFVFLILRGLADPYVLSSLGTGDTSMLISELIGGMIGSLILVTVLYLGARKVWRMGTSSTDPKSEVTDT